MIDKDRSRLLLAKIIEDGKKFWDEANKQFEDRIKEYPVYLRYAIDRYNEQVVKQMATGNNPAIVDSLEKHVIDLVERDVERDPERDRKLQAQRAQAPRAKRTQPDALDKLILDGLKQRKSTKEIWSWIVKHVAGKDGLELDGDYLVVRYDDGRADRRIKEISFKDIVSRLRNTISTSPAAV